jgi:hypothetical protein
MVPDPLSWEERDLKVATRGTGGSNPLSCRLWCDGTTRSPPANAALVARGLPHDLLVQVPRS